MSGCCMMLTNTYPVKVNVPVRLLLTLVDRILMVDGSLPEMSFPFMTDKQQENICSELPVLHLCSLELLTAFLKATCSQLLPHAASIVRIITKYFKTCALPGLRIKVYSVAKTLLISMGVGMALCLVQAVINNAIADLSTTENKNGKTLNGSNSVSTAAPLPANHTKRKHSSTTGSLQEYDKGGGLGVKVLKNRPLTPISLRIAALEALESLITVAGALRSEQWRSKVDSLLIVIAMDSFKEGSSSEEINVFQQKEPAATATDMQLAALRALLASFLLFARFPPPACFLSFARFPPPYLAQGLELFRRVLLVKLSAISGMSWNNTGLPQAVEPEIEPERIVSDSTVPHMESGQGSIIVRSNSSSLQTTSDSNMVQEFASKLNYGLSVVDEDAFPDIVDVDPDSDKAYIL